LNVATELSFSDVNVSLFGSDQQLATCQVWNSEALTLLCLAVQTVASFEGSFLAGACSRLAFSVLPHGFDALLISYALVTDAFAIWKIVTQTVSVTKLFVVWYQAEASDFFSISKRWDLLWDASCPLLSVCQWFFLPGRAPGEWN